MSSPVSVSVVIPAYREEENLRLLLPRLAAALQRCTEHYEILVVDTISPQDSTPQLCRELGVRCVSRGPTNSYGDGVRTGIRMAQHPLIAFMDADGSHAPEQLVALLDLAVDQDVVIGSRYVRGGYTENPWSLQLMSRLVNLAYSVVLGLRVKDVSNSLKVYRAELLKGLRLRCDNFDIIEEMIFKISRRYPSAKFLEAPVAFRRRMFGETKRSLLLFMLSYVATLIRLRFSDRD